MEIDTHSKFSSKTVLLHWLVATFVLCLLVVGIYMTETETYSLYFWHKSFGVLAIVFIIVRVIWRIKNGWPSALETHAAWEHALARFVHWVLILSTLLMPLSGFLMSALSGNGVSFFGFDIVPRNPDPIDPTKVIAHNGTLAGVFHSTHHWVAYALCIAILLHVAGALKHHVIDKDGTMRRMLGKEI